MSMSDFKGADEQKKKKKCADHGMLRVHLHLQVKLLWEDVIFPNTNVTYQRQIGEKKRYSSISTEED